MVKRSKIKCKSRSFVKGVQFYHLNGDRKNIADTNLVGLCPNCHKMIHTYEFFQKIKQVLKDKGCDTSKIHPTNYVNKRAVNGKK